MNFFRYLVYVLHDTLVHRLRISSIREGNSTTICTEIANRTGRLRTWDVYPLNYRSGLPVLPVVDE